MAQILSTFEPLLKVLVPGVFIGYILQSVLPTGAPGWVLQHPQIASFATVLFLTLTYNFLRHPRFINPLRHVPIGTEPMKKPLTESPRGAHALRRCHEFPDAQLIRGPARFGIGGVLATGPDALRDILNTNVYDFQKPKGLRNFLARAIGWGLILVEADEHRKQRRILTPAFNIKKIRELYGLMWQKTQILMKSLESDIARNNPDRDGFAVIEVSEWASKLTLDIIGPTAMGRDFQSLTSEHNEVADNFLELLRPSTDRLIFMALHFLLPTWFVKMLPLANNRMMTGIGNFLRQTCRDIVIEKKRDIKQQGNGPTGSSAGEDFDILSQIMKTGELQDQEIIDEMLTFLAAGHETTASALTWACYLCARHPEIQKKLRREIHANIHSSSSSITWDLLESSMPYLNGVCEETLRLYPTVPLTVREAIRPTTVAGYAVPKGSFFVLVPYAINRHPRFWGENADMIVPERWIDTLPDGTTRPNKNGGQSTNFSEITFLHGPRSCIGRDFAKAELRCAVAGVIGKFEIELHTQEEPKAAGVITMKADGGMHLRLKPIQTW